MPIVETTCQPGATVCLVARQHGVRPNQLSTLAAQRALTAAAASEEVVPPAAPRAAPP